MPTNHRIITSGDDWLRDVERRLSRQERRPEPKSLKEQFGVGIGQRARQIIDWNDPQHLRNGWYYADALSLNSPDPTMAWLGEVTVTYDGHGVQRVWSHTHAMKPIGFVRQFHFHPGAIMPDFTDWGQFAGPSGGLVATHLSSQSVVTNTWTTITSWLVAADHGPAAKVVEYLGTGVFVIKRDGWYNMQATIAFAPTTSTVYTALTLNGTTFSEGGVLGSSTVDVGAQATWEGPFVEGDLIRVQAFHHAGTNLSTTEYSSSVRRSFMHIRQVSY